MQPAFAPSVVPSNESTILVPATSVYPVTDVDANFLPVSWARVGPLAAADVPEERIVVVVVTPDPLVDLLLLPHADASATVATNRTLKRRVLPKLLIERGR